MRLDYWRFGRVGELPYVVRVRGIRRGPGMSPGRARREDGRGALAIFSSLSYG